MPAAKQEGPSSTKCQIRAEFGVKCCVGDGSMKGKVQTTLRGSLPAKGAAGVQHLCKSTPSSTLDHPPLGSGEQSPNPISPPQRSLPTPLSAARALTQIFRIQYSNTMIPPTFLTAPRTFGARSRHRSVSVESKASKPTPASFFSAALQKMLTRGLSGRHPCSTTTALKPASTTLVLARH